MKKTIKRLGALVISLTMVMSLGAMVAADGEATLTGGEVGGFPSPDQVTVQSKQVKIAKEITAYNVDETAVCAPTISYTYAITAGDAGKQITDATTDHQSGVAVTRYTLAGITDDLDYDDTLAWTTAEDLTTSKTGAANTKYITVDFSNVVFAQAGVYRYKIDEALTTGYTYASSGVTETTDATNGHTRYLDVYVKAADTYTDGTSADDWDIYGYVCIYDNDDIDPTGDTTETGACKTNGFVPATNDGTAIKADSYYTFNVTVSKTLTGDKANLTHEFPMHVDFTNAAVTQNVLLKATTSGNVTDYTHTAAAASGLDGLAKIADGGSIKYIGIPCGTSVAVYETNDVDGTTYVTTVTVDGTAGDSKSTAWTTTPTQFIAYPAVEATYNSKLGTVTTTANTADSTDGLHTINVANVFQTISPTGIIIRSLPYAALVLVAGAMLVAVKMMNKNSKKEESKNEAN